MDENRVDIIGILKASRAARVKGELTPEKMEVAQSVSVIHINILTIGLAAARIFGKHVPENIELQLKSTLVDLNSRMTDYFDGMVDASTMRVAIEEAEAKATEIGKLLKAMRT